MIRLNNKPDLGAELGIWLSLSAKSQEGRWYRSRHYDLTLTKASSNPSSNQYGGVVSLPRGLLSTGGGLPHE